MACMKLSLSVMKTVHFTNHHKYLNCTFAIFGFSNSLKSVLFSVSTIFWCEPCLSLVSSFRVNAAVLCGLTVSGGFSRLPVCQFYSWKGKGLLSSTGKLQDIQPRRGLGPKFHSFSHLLSCLKGLTAWNASLDAQCLLLGNLIKGGETYTYTA